MKKILYVLLAVLTITLSGCVNVENEEAFNFASNLTSNQIMNDYILDDVTYGVLLAKTSNEYYQYMKSDVCTIFNVKEERVFVHLDEENYISPSDILVTYYYVQNENKVYKVIEGVHTEVEGLTDNSIEGISAFISTEEGFDSQFTTFDDLYPMMKQFLSNIDENSISSPGSHDIKLLSVSLNKTEFLEMIDPYATHINTLYETEIANSIIAKIQNSPHDSFHLDYLWDSSNDSLLPYFSISILNFNYYQAGSLIDDFVVEIPKCN